MGRSEYTNAIRSVMPVNLLTLWVVRKGGIDRAGVGMFRRAVKRGEPDQRNRRGEESGTGARSEAPFADLVSKRPFRSAVSGSPATQISACRRRLRHPISGLLRSGLQP